MESRPAAIARKQRHAYPSFLGLHKMLFRRDLLAGIAGRAILVNEGFSLCFHFRGKVLAHL